MSIERSAAYKNGYWAGVRSVIAKFKEANSPHFRVISKADISDVNNLGVVIECHDTRIEIEHP